MKAEEFCKKLLEIATTKKTLYVMGAFGAPAGYGRNRERYQSNNPYNKTADRIKMIAHATDDTFFFDCACLIKGVLWGFNGSLDRPYGGAGYCVNGVPDVGANTMCNRYGIKVSNSFKNIQNGMFVWVEGHIGVIVDAKNGLVVECTPKWNNGVQITNLGNIGNRTGNYRVWSKCGYLPWIEYDEVEPVKEPDTPKTDSEVGKRLYKVQKGDTLSKIASKYNTTVNKIVVDNKTKHPTITANHIVTGWNIYV